MLDKRGITWDGYIIYHRCYRFIRTVMEKLSSSSLLSTPTKLGDNVEGDEFYIKAGLKKEDHISWWDSKTR